MTETATMQSLPSIIWNGSFPSWNFTEVTAYPVRILETEVHLYLSPYTPEELKDILRRAVSGYRMEKRDVEIVREDRSIYIPLCDSHFVRLGRASGTAAEQRAFIDQHPELKPEIVEFTFGGLQLDTVDIDESDSILDISAELSGTIKVFQDLVDTSKPEEYRNVVRVNMAHHYTSPTEHQYRQYRNARRNKFVRKSTIWATMEQHSTLEALYDASVQSIDCAAVNGKACTAATKADWIGYVPLWHKLWVCDQIFGKLIEKNV